MKTVIRQPYKYDTAAVSDESAITFEEPSKTQQQFADEADINNIVDCFLRTGEVPQVNAKAIYGDFLNAPDSYQEALNLVIEAQEGFDALPSHVRARFNNDPQALLTFLQDEKNVDEGISLGLFEKPLESSKIEPVAVDSAPSTVGST